MGEEKNKSNEIKSEETSSQNRLGIDASSLGKLKPKDLGNPKTASMVLNYLNSVEAENSQLKTQNETLSTYSSAYEVLKNSSRTSAVISVFAVILVGFGINFVSSMTTSTAGWVLICVGVTLQIYSIWIAYKK